MRRLLLAFSLALLAGCASTQTAQNSDSRADDHARAAIAKRAMELSGQGHSYRDALARAESEYTGSVAPLRRAESGRRTFADVPLN